MPLRATYICVLAALLTSSASPAAVAATTVIHAGKLIDGVSARERSLVSIVIEGDRITGVQDGLISPPNAQIIDLSRHTVMPGLIDCHEHLVSGPDYLDRLRNTPSRMAFQAAYNARSILLAGFTSVRDVGGNIEVLSALKQAIARGMTVGPRLRIAGQAIGPTGGHSDPSNGIDSAWERSDDWKLGIVDGRDAAIHAVREMRKRGADLIKIHASGGVASAGDNPNLQLMRDDELQAVIETAHALGMKVAAHAHGKAGIDAAVRHGVDSIEHGTYADAQTYALMKEHGTYLVPTLFAGREIYEIAVNEPDRLPPGVPEKAKTVTPLMAGNLRRAHQAGVRIAFGTDQSGWSKPHGMNALELQYMVEAGMQPMDVLLSATRNAAELLGDTPNVGAIQPGRYADIIAVSGDPLTNISELQHVQFVMKGGQVYKSGGQPLVDSGSQISQAAWTQSNVAKKTFTQSTRR